MNRIHDAFRIDTDDRFHNTFFYEICPLLVIAEHVADENALISFTGTQSQFDGLIVFGDPRRAQRIELTAAIDGWNAALQMELLAKQGHAPAFQKIQATGTRRNRLFGHNQTEAIRSEDYDRGTLLPLLEKALTHKANKTRTNHQYVGAWLGIVFDDWICPLADRKKGRFDPICRDVLGGRAELYSPFDRVFFVGVSRRYLFDSGEINRG